MDDIENRGRFMDIKVVENTQTQMGRRREEKGGGEGNGGGM